MVQLLIAHARVEHEHEHGRARESARQLVLQSCVLRDQLSWQRCLADVLCVVRREVVARHAVGAGP